jgi:hypothetical protein
MRRRDKTRLAWIHTLGCIVPECPRLDIEADHVGARGYGQRCGDHETLPVCTVHHRTGKDARHVLGRKFWEHHGIDRATLLVQHDELYQSFLSGRHHGRSRKQTSTGQAYQAADPF